MSPPLNPPARELGRINAVVSGRARRYASRFAGPLSVKGVIAGRAVWETSQGRFEVMPGCALVLNDGEEYEVTADALQPVETFCLFFARGFVEDAFHATTTGSAALLDAASAPAALSFSERLHFDAPLVRELGRAHARMRRGETLEESFDDVALALAAAHGETSARVSRLPSLRAATRAELARRLEVATSYLHASLDRPVTVAAAAREACLSPFHFHRLFASWHGVTPHRYLTRLRLERARALLRANGLAIAEVAIACGFESAGSFAVLYKRAFGVTPGSEKKQESRESRAAARATIGA